MKTTQTKPIAMHVTTMCCLLWIIALILPGTVSALEELSDNELGTVSGQTGVGLFVDHMYIYSNVDQVSFQDPDGLTGTDGAALNINRMEVDILRQEQLGKADPDNPDTTIYDNNDFHVPFEELYREGDSMVIPEKFGTIMSMDVTDRLPVMSAASNYQLSGDYTANNGNVAGMYIGIPTWEIYFTELTIRSITMNSLGAATPANNGASFGSFKFDDLQIDILNGGVLEVAPHAGCGINIALDDTVIYGKLDQFDYFDYDITGDNDNEWGNRRFRITDLLIDAIQINALTHLDSAGQPASLGRDVFVGAGTQTDVCNTRQADYYNFLTGGWKNRFFSIDITNNLPAMSAMANAPVAGVYIGLPALEIFIDNLSYNFTLDVDDDEYIGTRIFKNFDLVFLEGALEIAPHLQYGMDIAIDDAVIYMSYDQLAYQDIDNDGMFCINNYEQDVLRINAIALTGNSLTSPGHGLHFVNTVNAPVGFTSPLTVPAGFTPSPMRIDMSNNLPEMSEEEGASMVGVSIGLPTVETYCDAVGIGSVSLEHPDVANPAHFFQNIRMQGVTHACLGGRIEIAPH